MEQALQALRTGISAHQREVNRVIVHGSVVGALVRATTLEMWARNGTITAEQYRAEFSKTVDLLMDLIAVSPFGD